MITINWYVNCVLFNEDTDNPIGPKLKPWNYGNSAESDNPELGSDGANSTNLKLDDETGRTCPYPELWTSFLQNCPYHVAHPIRINKRWWYRLNKTGRLEHCSWKTGRLHSLALHLLNRNWKNIGRFPDSRLKTKNSLEHIRSNIIQVETIGKLNSVIIAGLCAGCLC